MTSTRLSAKEATLVMWGILIAVIVALATYNYSLRNRQRSIAKQIIAIRERQSAHSKKLQEKETLRQSIRDAEAASFATDHRVRLMLRECHSRDEFLVREGQRIAWSELQGSSATEQKLGLYVPAGKHWLRWQTASGEAAIPLRGTYFNEASHRLTPITSFLPQGGQVYEVRIALDPERKKAELTLLGEANNVISRSTLASFSDACEVSMQVKRHAFAYPSQIQASYASRLDFERPQTLPAAGTSLALVDFTADGRSHAQTLVWIDSDAKPCVSAIEFVTYNRSFAQMNWRRGRAKQPGVSPSTISFEEAFFEPSDDSDRLYFRRELFGR